MIVEEELQEFDFIKKNEEKIDDKELEEYCKDLEIYFFEENKINPQDKFDKNKLDK